MNAWLLLALAAYVAPESDAPLNVVGGHEVASGTWEDTAAVYFGNMVGCTGVLIAPNLALTAGHCAGGISKIRVGTNNYNSGGEFLSVEEEHEYPNSQSTYDITLLVLSDTATTAPRMIAQECVLDEFLYDGADVMIVGYGATNVQGTQYDSKLREAQTTVSDHDCSDFSSGCNHAVSPNGELGAGGDGVDSCFGDSGGPLYLLTPEGDYLVGLTSRGYNTATQPCGQGGIYARPDAIIDWIESTSGYELEKPDCGVNSPPAPSAAPLTVNEGESGQTVVEPHDPDASDSHIFLLIQSPALGEAEVDDNGTVTYTSQAGQSGEDEVTVRVADDGDPTLSTDLVIPVTVVPASAGDDDASDDDVASDDDDASAGDDDDQGEAPVRSGCGCDSVPPPSSTTASGLLFSLLAWANRRRRIPLV